MRILVSNFLIAILILGISIFSRRPASADQMEQANDNVEFVKSAMNVAQSEVKSELENGDHAVEWQTFRNEAVEIIHQNELRIMDLMVKMNKPGTALDAAYVKKTETLTQKNIELKAGLKKYEENQSGWEVFKQKFNHDMEKLSNALEDLAINNNK